MIKRMMSCDQLHEHSIDPILLSFQITPFDNFSNVILLMRRNSFIFAPEKSVFTLFD